MSKPSVDWPPGCLGGSVLLWGLCTGQLALGMGVAALIELPRYTALRLDLAPRHFERTADLTSVGFVLLSVYEFTEHALYGIYQILALLPACLAPLVLAQCYSVTQTSPVSALVMSLRRGGAATRGIDLRGPFGILCLLAAATGHVPPLWYAAGIALLLVYLLWTARPRRYSGLQWVLAVGLALGIGVGVQGSLLAAQLAAGQVLQYWFNQLSWIPDNPNREYTAIGSLGRLKLSDRIRIRVQSGSGLATPLLLTEAAYQDFKNGIWSNHAAPLAAIDPVLGELKWRVGSADVEPRHRLALTVERRGELGLLPLPAGTQTIAGADIIELQRNDLGAILAEARPGQLAYAVAFDRNQHLRALPQAADLAIPAGHRELIAALAAELGLADATPEQAVGRVRRFFAEHFRYSLIQDGYFPGRAPLAQFLTRNRKGHCEYFATATVLLLRAAGIPARYTVGYAVDEYSRLERAYVARARHAHAWAGAYVGDKWVAIDTTPAAWFELEDQRASAWQHALDVWSWGSFQYARFKRGELPGIKTALVISLPLLVLLLAWRLRHRTRRVAPAARTGRARERAPANPSALDRLVDALCVRGLTPQRGETLARFLSRHLQPHRRGVSLAHLLSLHYALRFRPQGLSRDQLQAFNDGVDRYSRQQAGEKLLR